MIVKIARAYPSMCRWLRGVRKEHAAAAKPVDTFGHQRLRLFYPDSLLAASKVVVTDHLPTPPLEQWGLGSLGMLSSDQAAAITFLDTFFVRSGHVNDEALFFHELVHVVQWRLLGMTRFLLLYAIGLAERGYMDSPLEATAFRLGDTFEAGADKFDAYDQVAHDTRQLVKNYRSASLANRFIWAVTAIAPRQ